MMSETIDIVVVSNASRSRLWQMTAQTIKTGINNAGVPAKALVVEECLWSRPQARAKMLYYDFEFNYNRCLNLGLHASTASYIAFCNNDLYFESNWAKNAIKAMKDHDLMSVSPTPNHIFQGVRYGYRIGKVILGWCIITDRRIFETITKFAEVVKFWYSDDVYADQLKAAGIRHALVGNSKVIHYGSVTTQNMGTGRKRSELTRGQGKLYQQFKEKIHAITNAEIEAKRSGDN